MTCGGILVAGKENFLFVPEVVKDSLLHVKRRGDLFDCRAVIPSRRNALAALLRISIRVAALVSRFRGFPAPRRPG
jgi:hypothetical protein